MRPSTTENFIRHFVVSLFFALIWNVLTKYGNINSIFRADKISADNKCRNTFVNEMIL